MIRLKKAIYFLKASIILNVNVVPNFKYGGESFKFHSDPFCGIDLVTYFHGVIEASLQTNISRSSLLGRTILLRYWGMDFICQKSSRVTQNV